MYIASPANRRKVSSSSKRITYHCALIYNSPTWLNWRRPIIVWGLVGMIEMRDITRTHRKNWRQPRWHHIASLRTLGPHRAVLLVLVGCMYCRMREKNGLRRLRPMMLSMYESERKRAKMRRDRIAGDKLLWDGGGGVNYNYTDGRACEFWQYNLWRFATSSGGLCRALQSDSQISFLRKSK